MSATEYETLSPEARAEALESLKRETLVELFEGNDSTADLALRIANSHPNTDPETLAELFADELSGFYDPDNGDTEEEHWQNNYEWGLDLFEEYVEWESEQ